MLSRKAIEYALVTLCLVAIACNDGDDQAKTGSTQDKRTEYSQKVNSDLKRAKDFLTAASNALVTAQGALSSSSAAAERNPSVPSAIPSQQKQLKASPTATPAQRQFTVPLPDSDRALDEVNGAVKNLEQANGLLDSLNSVLIAGAVSGETQGALGEAKASVNKALSKLKEVTAELSAPPDEAGENVAKDTLQKTKTDLLAAQADINSATKAAAQLIVPENLTAPPSFFGQLLSDWGTTIAIALGALFGLILLALGAKGLVKSMGAEFERQLTSGVKPVLASMHKQQKDFAAQLSSLASSNNELNTRLSEIQTEVRSVGRLVREGSLDGGVRRPSASADSYPPTDQSPPRDEPVFPISTVDYLGKMQRMTLVVKPDFQNGILVTDPDGKGELALIRDPKVDDNMHSLPVVPRAATFQTKQDFHTYYEKYYDCTRPSAGEVWIVEPAVVSKVQGGWQLRKKGVLEIR